jgi:alkyl sulfatase BDS1-like metallo-beta-lactamase superfamily hydrolase
VSAPPSFDDRTDFDDAGRGFVAALTQGRLCSKQGLFEVTDGIYQVRDLDRSNVSFIEGDSGVIVIDPLISTECAAAALSLYREQRGDRPVTAVIYTHSRGDHFGGVRGVVPDGASIPIIARAGFLEHAVSENLYAGTVMTRRAVYTDGAGLGLTTSTGTISLIPPTLDITRTGQEEVVDGVRIVFQLPPGTEAPSELNCYLPGRRALCAAEHATHDLHDLLTLGSAAVRNPHTWSRYLTETIELFGGEADVMFASHHWPTWGRQQIKTFLTKQRDLYAYQQYLGSFDGSPAQRWELPPAEGAKKHVEYMGGADAIIARVQDERDNPRWAAQVLNYVVSADPDNAQARAMLAGVRDSLATEPAGREVSARR